MAQRKPKESLIAEIPKPRLTDEELMELFYGGNRKSTTKSEKDPASSSLIMTDAEPELSNNDLRTIKPSLNIPSHEEPIYKEPSVREPIIDQSVRKNPSDSRIDVISPHESTALKDEQKTAEIYRSPVKTQDALASSTVETSLPENLRSLEGDPVNEQENQKTEIVAEGPFIGSKGEGSFGEGLNPLTSQPGESLRKAFDVLPMLAPLEQLVYLWFLNLSWELGRNSCRMTMSTLQRATGISEKLVRETIRSLLKKELVQLLDGGAAGKAALYRVSLPAQVTVRVNQNKGSQKEGSQKEGSQKEPSVKFPSFRNLSERNLPSHIERESFSYTLSKKLEPSHTEPFSREGSQSSSLPIQIADNVIDRFYSMTGQTRISRQKRERSRLQLLDLIQQGFQVDDVLHAIDWAREHINGRIHSFGLIPEIIGQALGDRSSSRPTQKPSERRNAQQRNSKSDAEVEREQQEHAKLESIYEKLPVEEQEALRSEASRIVESEYGQHVPGQQTLVRIKLMELIRERHANRSAK